MVSQLLRENAQSVVQECTRSELLNFLEDPSKENLLQEIIKNPALFGRGFLLELIHNRGLCSRNLNSMHPYFRAYLPSGFYKPDNSEALIPLYILFFESELVLPFIFLCNEPACKLQQPIRSSVLQYLLGQIRQFPTGNFPMAYKEDFRKQRKVDSLLSFFADHAVGLQSLAADDSRL